MGLASRGEQTLAKNLNFCAGFVATEENSTRVVLSWVGVEHETINKLEPKSALPYLTPGPGRSPGRVTITSSSSILDLSSIVAAARPSVWKGVCRLTPSLLSLPPLGRRHRWQPSSSTDHKAQHIVVIIAPSSSLLELLPSCPSSSNNSHHSLPPPLPYR